MSILKFKMFLTNSTLIAVISIISVNWFVPQIVFKMERVVYVNTLDQPPYHLIIPTLNLEPISDPLSDISDQLSPQIIQEILKASGVDLFKFEFYKHCKAKCHAATQATKI